LLHLPGKLSYLRGKLVQLSGKLISSVAQHCYFGTVWQIVPVDKMMLIGHSSLHNSIKPTTDCHKPFRALLEKSVCCGPKGSDGGVREKLAEVAP